jgi:DNA helicase II / ATP-dependent DNA helicase PcrA
MKFLEDVRAKARACRAKIGLSPVNLLERIEQHIGAAPYFIELQAVDKAVIDDGQAELSPIEKSLYYNDDLNNDLEQKLWVVCHELGHLEQHDRLTKLSCKPDPIFGSMYSCAGTNSLTRYNKKSLEEVQANAFAAEFLCPSDEVFRIWRSNPDLTLQELAVQTGAPVFVVRAQLAEALYQLAFGANIDVEKEKSEFEREDNPKQEEAAKHLHTPVLVEAGPGTGKTATLIQRIEFLLTSEADNGVDEPVDPSNILVLTFSNEACNELYERIASKFGEEVASKITISTFHGFGLSIIQLHGQFQDIDANALILDEAGQRELANEVLGKVPCYEILKLSQPHETVKEIIRHITFLKERMHTPESLKESISVWKSDSEEADPSQARDFQKVFEEYEKLKTERERLDFADLIQKSIGIFESQPEVREMYQEKYKWVLVDEYQDVSRATAVFLKHLCGVDNPPWVVGDKRQSIFRFCGSHPENIDKFEEDFPNAKRFSLNKNYRSSSEIVENNNSFANLMQKAHLKEAVDPIVFWETGTSNPKSNIQPAVAFAVANSDKAEYDGIVKQVQFWLENKVTLRDIAVLARRNVDVRNIVLALAEKKIPAIASGIITADGRAGDLAAALTFADKPRSFLPRLVYYLGKGRFSKESLDEIIADLLENFGKDQDLKSYENPDKARLIEEIQKIHRCLVSEQFTSDAFSTICVFLFEASDYLRKILASDNEIEKSLALNEIVTTLTFAATYRFSHHRSKPPIKPQVARKNFAQYFRDLLSKTANPATSPPSQTGLEAVKVMTCHASKGLEFPFVIVSGQTLSGMGKKAEYKWLPPALCPKAEEDEDQSDSALFVGLSRSKQGLVISHTKTPKRKIVPLLENWINDNLIQPLDWNDFSEKEKDFIEHGKIWGGAMKYPLGSKKLDKKECSLAIYVNDALHLKFPVVDQPIYPIFYVTVRNVLSIILKRSAESSIKIDEEEARQILRAEWDKAVDKDHPHNKLYLSIAERYVTGFSSVIFELSPGNAEFIDLLFGEDAKEIQLDLVAIVKTGNDIKAVLFRPESLKKELDKKGLLTWGKIESKHRNSLVLLKEKYDNLQVVVFSGEDGLLYDFQWSNAYYEKQKITMAQKARELASDIYITEVKEFTCNNFCEHRLSCPHWLNL